MNKHLRPLQVLAMAARLGAEENRAEANMAFNWTCPHCNTAQTVTDQRFAKRTAPLGLQHQAEGKLGLESTAIGCANPECERTSLRVRIGETWYSNSSYEMASDDNDDSIVFSQMLIPQGSAKPQPDYIPEPLRQDYYEACLIRDFSPKASATLTRRCLQGMIRDFAKIAKGTLAKEIEALKKSVEDSTADRAISMESVEAIDHVRGIGNIGAHMEKDINLIVEVDPGEAQALIELVELLFDEWYGARHSRQAKLHHIEKIAGAKKQAKQPQVSQSGTGVDVSLDALVADPDALQIAVEESLSATAKPEAGADEGG